MHLTFDLETHSADEQWSGRKDFVRLAGYQVDDEAPCITVDPYHLLREFPFSDTIIGHNIMSYDLPVLARYYGVDMHRLVNEGRVVDTKLTAFLNDPPSERMKAGQVEKAYSLQTLTGAKVGDLKALAKEFGGYGEIPVTDHRFIEYLEGDVQAARQLYCSLRVDEYVLREHRVAAIAAQISINGFRVDRIELDRRIREGAATKRAGIQVLTDHYGLPTTKKDGKPVTSPQATEAGKHAIDQAFRDRKVTLPRTKGGSPAIGQEVIDHVIDKYADDPEVVALAETVKSLNGVRTVYQTVQDNLVGERVHPDIAMRQVSGRWSITKPGLTVMGKRGGRHHEREIFLPEDGETIIAVDLNQIDARAIAAHSQDPEYMQLFEPGRDMHTEIAERVWGDPTMREQAKVIGHGWNYGMGALGIARHAGVDYDEALTFDNAMTEAFPRLVEWRTEVREKAEAGDLLDNGFGRMMRPNPDRAWTQGPALMGQGTARDLLMEGLLRLPPEILPMLRAVVHDEVVLSVPQYQAYEITGEVTKALSFEWTPPHGTRPISVTADLAGPPASTWGGVYDK